MTEVPGALRIDARHRAFAERVMVDVNRINGTPCGHALLQRLHASGAAIRVECAAATVPPNAALRREPHRFVIAYNPVHWPNPAIADSPHSDALLFGLMLHALELAATGPERLPQSDAAPSPAEQALLARYRRERYGE